MLFGKSKGPRARRSRWFNQARLAVEALEDRYLLATCLWSGAGMDANWSNPSNWGGTAPVAGDNLVFAAGASQLASYNDFAAGTSFGSITFQAGGYSVSGNAVVLTAGISATNPTGADALNLDVTLGASQSFAPANAGTALNLGGAVNLNGFTLTLDGAGSTSLTGGTSGTGGLVKNGTGTLTLAGNNPCSAPVTLNAGTLLANGSQAAGAVTVNAGGTLGGTGTLGAVTVAGGGVDPGAPGGTALLSATGNVAFGIGSTCSVQLNGALAGTGYDQLSVNGTVNLGGSTLNASLGYAPNPGDSYTIIHSSRGITGTFNNLPNGAVLSVGGKTFQISYTATDVVLTQVQAGTTTTVTSSLTPSTAGQAVTFTATVSAGQGMGTPTGMVTFVIDGIAQPGVALVNGQAAFTTSALTAGSHTIIAYYGGGATFSGSTSAALNQMVNPAATTTALSSSAGSSVYGQAVTFTATVSSAGAGTPVGMVTFLDGTTVLGTALLSGGSASFTTSSLAVGEHWITAVYGGGNFLGSTSAALCQAVNSTGNAWQHQQVVTLSFVPDGTDLGGYQSNLFATFNSMFGSPTVWQDQIL
ncbi:MAG TPA: Ig-like domain-containing protein, partial [Gemmataceae bacterium]|nr:Ig-like domain-containing protein [Gemmataceae bacterium]